MNEEDPMDVADPMNVPLSAITVRYGILILGLVVLLFISVFIYTAYQNPSILRLRDAQRLATFLANLVVVSYAFPAFKRTKHRAWLCIAFAALNFAILAVFTILLGSSPRTASQGQWYYVVLYIADTVGLLLYAYGVVSLARRAIVREAPKA